jgi:hypothetical protein
LAAGIVAVARAAPIPDHPTHDLAPAILPAPGPRGNHLIDNAFGLDYSFPACPSLPRVGGQVLTREKGNFMAKRKTHDVNEVANDPTDVFAEAAAQASTPAVAQVATIDPAPQPAEERRHTLQEALAATTPRAHAEHAAHATAPAPQSNGNGHAAAQVVQSVADATAMPEEYKPKWIDRFAEYVDTEAGVKLRKDRKNGLSTIAFRDAPSQAVLDLLDAHGYQFDQEFGVFAKKVSELRPVESRTESAHLAFDAANIIRGEKGLERKMSGYISREEHTR